MFDVLQKKFADHVEKPFLIWYLKKPRIYNYQGLRLTIYPSVFHPAFFFSTQFMLEFLQTLNIKGKNFCEMGAGSGLISFTALHSGAKVTAVDLNKKAIEGLTENHKKNFHGKENFKIYYSDIFNQVPPQQFDYMFINPPYFFKEVEDEASMAWNCGENGEYFKKLFNQLFLYSHSNTGIYMVLADNCDLGKINTLAKNEGLILEKVAERKIKWEKNFIFKINRDT